MKSAYRECAQLSGTTFLPDRQNLRDLASHTQHTGTRLQRRQHLRIHNLRLQDRKKRRPQSSHKHRRARILPTIMQHQRANHDILQRNQRALAKRAERVSLADIVREGDEEGGRLEQVGEEGDAGRGLRVDELEELRDLDDGAGADDANAETFADGEFEAVGVVDWVDVEDEVFVAHRAEQVVAKLV